jgi:EAL domain-containing protein (putative c-di-GMP-specific phosphodiesterase class I)/GGDEF domain-containing protein
MVDKKWKDRISHIDYAFQPIINIHTGLCSGVEALLRNQQEAGFETIDGFFDAAHEEHCLFGVDRLLREKAIRKFFKIDFHQKIKLFYNLDNRVLLNPDYTPGYTSELLSIFGMNQSALCFEISERHELQFGREIEKVFNAYKQQTYQIAIDDFGTGFSGMQLLYHSEPDFIKIDRFFITAIETDPKKKLFVSNIIKLAHILGIQVIAEGIETEKEFYVCHDIGCDYVQGYLIQRPTVNLEELTYRYEEVIYFNNQNLRKVHTDERLIYNQMEHVAPVCYPEHSMSYLFDVFRRQKTTNFLPVVNTNREPLGVVKEKDLKEYVYSPFGKDLLKNQRLNITPLTFLTKTPVVEITTEVEQILGICTIDKNCEVILVTENGKYLGFLSMMALLNLLNEKNLAVARDQNPLSKLPGNTIINSQIAQALKEQEGRQMFVYFDFDDFKPFNDIYGFRRGDRAILLFADMLKELSHIHQFFVGHIGGDDFFASIHLTNGAYDHPLSLIKAVLTKFRDDAVNLYDDEAKNSRYIISKNREGEMTHFPLLTVSAAVLIVCNGTDDLSLEDIAQSIAGLKQEAKKRTDKMAVKCLDSRLENISDLIPQVTMKTARVQQQACGNRNW